MRSSGEVEGTGQKNEMEKHETGIEERALCREIGYDLEKTCRFSGPGEFELSCHFEVYPLEL
jgi:hypothetical protein